MLATALKRAFDGRSGVGFAAISAAIIIAGSASGELELFVDDGAPLGGDGLSWETAYRYLQDAMRDAEQAAGAAVIRVGQGEYQPDQDEGGSVNRYDRYATFQLLDDVALRGGYAGYGAADPDERNISLYRTILHGDLFGNDQPGFEGYLENSLNVVTGSDVGETAVLDGFTIMAGNANKDSGNGPYSNGGGMYNEDGSPTVVDCTFSLNIAIYSGGGMYNYGPHANPVVDHCVFDGNALLEGGSSAGGGAMSNIDQAKPTIVSTLFINNTAARDGGAMVNDNNARPVVSQCVFQFNEASSGGAVYNAGNAVRFEDCVFMNNTANVGGAMANSGDGPIIERCRFLYNTAGGGGAMYNGGTEAKIHECIFESNSAERGGAVSNGSGGDAYFWDCQFTHNTATWAGGAMAIDRGHPTVTRCSFSANTAEIGGALHLTHPWDTQGGGGDFIECSFGDNEATGAGGALYIELALEMQFTDCVVTGNYAPVDGGAAYITRCCPAFSGCTFQQNTVNPSFGEGGAICNFDEASPVLNYCTFTGNEAGTGGGMSSFLDCSPVLMGCRFEGNQARDGGGIAGFVDCHATLEECVLEGNIAEENGGGIWTRIGGLSLTGCELRANESEYGGGIYDNDADMTLADCEFTDNYANLYGGGVYAMGESGVSAADCVFHNNSAMWQAGGGVFSEEGNFSPHSFVNCEFTENRNSGLAFDDCNEVRIIDCEFHDNTGNGPRAVSGGALTIEGCLFTGHGYVSVKTTEPGDMTMTECVFRNNLTAVVYDGGGEAVVTRCGFVEGSHGGGVLINSGNGTVIDCVFDHAGGGVAHQGTGGKLLVVGCRIEGNEGSLYPGDEGYLRAIDCVIIGNDRAISGPDNGEAFMSIENCLIAGNEYAVFDRESSTHCDLINCTIVDNESGIMFHWEDQKYRFDNCIIWNSPFDLDGGDVLITYSDVEGGYPGPGNIDVDPQFVVPSEDFHLAPGSPCIDAADNTAVPDDITFDLDGNPRFIDDPDTPDTGNGEPPIVDMGAYEYNLGLPCPADVNRDQVVDINDLFAVLGAWGTWGNHPEDVNEDGFVDVNDVFKVMYAWGACP